MQLAAAGTDGRHSGAERGKDDDARPIPRPVPWLLGAGLVALAILLSLAVGRKTPGRLLPVAVLVTLVISATALLVTMRSLRVARKRALEAEAANRALARSNADLEQFAYVASHDLQEPLRMVASYVGLLDRRYSDALDDDARELIGFAVDGARRMQRLIDDLLAYSRTARRELDLRPLDADAVLTQVLTDLARSIEEEEATVHREPLPTVLADESQLAQVLRNLIGNALKFGDDRPNRIRIAAEIVGDEAVFRVEDRGIGIAPEHQERIFQLFQRLHGHDSYPGTGIGLALVDRIVERHGGRVWLDSTPGHGSTFYFSIPQASGKAA